MHLSDHCPNTAGLPPRGGVAGPGARLALSMAASISLCAGSAIANDIFSPENLGNAFPLVVFGSNCGAGNNDTLGCELGVQGFGEDYWYLWTPPQSGEVCIDVCDASFDTILDVIDANTFVSIACNDDSCGISGFRSRTAASLSLGQSVIIGIDSWGGEPCGSFTLVIDVCVDCTPYGVCPSGALIEAESCGSALNDGCNMASPAFDFIARGDVVCGTMWADGGIRDTDWRRYNHPGGSLEYSISSQVPAVLMLVEGNFNDCTDVAVVDFVTTGGVCGSATLSIADLDCGEWVLFTAPDGFDGFPCGGDNAYVIVVDGFGTCSPSDCPPACAPVCPPGTALSSMPKSYQISGTANGVAWSWRLERISDGETIAAYCNVAGVLPSDDLDGSGTPGLAGDVAYRFAESINDFAVLNGCEDVLRAASAGGTLPGSPAFLSIETSLPGSDYRLLVGPAGSCANCAVVFSIPSTPCPFNPMIEELLLPGIDCDGNGWDDILDIVFFGAADDNGNGIPDVCEGIVGFGFELIPFGGAALNLAPDTGNLSVVSPAGGGPAGFYINLPKPSPSGFWWNNPLLCLLSSDLFELMSEGEGIAYKLGSFGEEADVYTSLRFQKEQQPSVSIIASWTSYDSYQVTIQALSGQTLLSSQTGPNEWYGGGPSGFQGSPKVFISPCALVQSVRYLPFWFTQASGFSRPWEVTFALPTTVTMPDGEMVEATTLRIFRHWPFDDPTFSYAEFEVNLPAGTTFELNGLATSGEQFWGTAVGDAMILNNEVEDEQFLVGNFSASGLDGLVLLAGEPAEQMAFAAVVGAGWGVGDRIDFDWWAPRGCCFSTTGCAPSDQKACQAVGGIWDGSGVGCYVTDFGFVLCVTDFFDWRHWDLTPSSGPIAWGATLIGTSTGTVVQPNFTGLDAFTYSASAVLAGDVVASFSELDGQIAMPLLSLPIGYRAEVGTITMVWDASTPVQVDINGVLVELDTLHLTAEDPILPTGGIIGAQVLAANIETLSIGRYPIACPADIDGDGEVTFADLVFVLSAWGPCSPEGKCPADVNGDGVVDLNDLLLVLASFGACP